MAFVLVMMFLMIVHNPSVRSPLIYAISLIFVLPPMQKNLLLYLWGCHHQLSVLDSLGGNQFAGDLVHFVAAPPDDDDLQTIVFVQMNMQAGIHGHMCLMLHV